MRRHLVAIAIASCAVPAIAQNGSQASPVTALHDSLHLNANQDAAWRGYTAALNGPSNADQRRRAAAALFPSLTAPRRMELVQAEMQQELTDLGRQAAALKTLYAALTPEQQRTFDTMTLQPPPESDQRP